MLKEVIPYFSCIATPDSMAEAIEKYSEVYFQNPDGSVLKHVKLSGGRYVRLPVEIVPKIVKDNLPDMFKVVSELNFLPAGKIPHSYFEQIVQFFRDVIKLKKAQFEAHAWILWTPERGYFISIPKQTVSAAQVAFTYDKEALPEGAVIVVDIHSHNSMGAFYSGTDDNNDKTGIYYSGVVGKLTDTSFDFVFRFNLNEAKLKCKLEDVFEMPAKPEVQVPQEWLDNVSVAAPSYLPGKGYPGYNAGNHGKGNSVHNQTMGKGRHVQEYDRPLGNKYDFSQKNRKGDNTDLYGGLSEETIKRWQAETSGNTSHLASSEEINQRLAAAAAEAQDQDLIGATYEEKNGVLIDTGSGEVIELASRRSLRQGESQSQESKSGSAENSSDDKTSTFATGTSGQNHPYVGDHERDSDSIVFQNALDLPGEYDYYAAQFGDLVAGAKEDIDNGLQDIRDCDEALEDTARQAIGLMSNSAKSKMFQELWASSMLNE
jgi:PRTRC genetic system protein A